MLFSVNAISALAPTSNSIALSSEKFSDIELEVADVAIYLLRLSDVLGIDLAEIVRKKLEINQSRF